MGIDVRTVTASADGEQDRQAAFEAEALPEAGHLYGLALAIIGDPGEAQDIVQETLISAWRGWASLCEPERLSAWLMRICINHSIHRRRLLHRRVLWSRERWEAEQVIPAFVECGSSTCTEPSARCRGRSGPWSCSTTATATRSRSAPRPSDAARGRHGATSDGP